MKKTWKTKVLHRVRKSGKLHAAHDNSLIKSKLFSIAIRKENVATFGLNVMNSIWPFRAIVAP
jgi:hypothetical protein